MLACRGNSLAPRGHFAGFRARAVFPAKCQVILLTVKLYSAMLGFVSLSTADDIL
jgi:hypothetical protein